MSHKKFARDRLFKTSNLIKNSPQKTKQYLETCLNIEKMKSSGRSGGVRVTYTGYDVVEKLYIDEELKSDLRELERNVINAVNDAREKKLKEWEKFHIVEEYEDALSGGLFNADGIRDPYFNPDQLDIAPQIFDQPFLNILRGANQVLDYQKFFSNPESFKDFRIYAESPRVSQKDIDEYDPIEDLEEKQ